VLREEGATAKGFLSFVGLWGIDTTNPFVTETWGRGNEYRSDSPLKYLLRLFWPLTPPPALLVSPPSLGGVSFHAVPWLVILPGQDGKQVSTYLSPSVSFHYHSHPLASG